MNKKDNIDEIKSMRKCKKCGTNLRLIGTDGSRYKYYCPKYKTGDVEYER